MNPQLVQGLCSGTTPKPDALNPEPYTFTGVVPESCRDEFAFTVMWWVCAIWLGSMLTISMVTLNPILYTQNPAESECVERCSISMVRSSTVVERMRHK